METIFRLKKDRHELSEKMDSLETILIHTDQKTCWGKEAFLRQAEAHNMTKGELTRVNNYMSTMNKGTNNLDQILSVQLPASENGWIESSGNKSA